MISSFGISGPNASDFSVSAGQCASVAPGATCAVQVNFNPTGQGQRSAVLSISDNGPNSPQSLGISGIGSPAFTLQARSGYSSVVTSGGTAFYNINLSTAPGFKGTVQLTCAGAPPNATCSPTSPITVTGGVEPVAAVVTVFTGASTSLILPGPPTFFATILLCIAIIFDFRRRPKFRLPRSILALALLGIGCGGGPVANSSSQPTPPTNSSKTPAGTYELTVTATSSGAQTQNLTLTLVVQ